MATSAVFAKNRNLGGELYVGSNVSVQGYLYAPNTIIQTQRLLQYQSAAHIATSSATFIDTGINITISPKVQTSKITITFSSTMANLNNQAMHVALYRKIGAGANTNITTNSYNWGYSTCSATYYFPLTLTFIDTPSTTSPVTYSVWMKAVTGTPTLVHQFAHYSFITDEVAT